MANLRSYKVFGPDGDLSFVLIIRDDYTLTELNNFLRKGLSVTVVDQRSTLVDKTHVDRAVE